jgi:hypothetical protein
VTEVRLDARENHLTKTRLPRGRRPEHRGVDQRSEGDDHLPRLCAGIALRSDEGPHTAAERVLIDWVGGERRRDHRTKVFGIGDVCYAARRYCGTVRPDHGCLPE